MYVPLMCLVPLGAQMRALENSLERELQWVCVPPCVCWELNHGPLQEQQVLSIAQPSLQPPYFISSLVLSVVNYFEVCYICLWCGAFV